MKTTAITAILASLLLVACNGDKGAPTAADDAAQASASAADAAAQTEAVYGDEAPVAIEAEAPADHAHNADGSHAPGDEHGDAADAPAADAHEHGDDEGEHTH